MFSFVRVVVAGVSSQQQKHCCNRPSMFFFFFSNMDFGFIQQLNAVSGAYWAIPEGAQKTVVLRMMNRGGLAQEASENICMWLLFALVRSLPRAKLKSSGSALAEEMSNSLGPTLSCVISVHS